MSLNLLTAKQVAQLLGLKSTTSVDNLVKNGWLLPRYIPGSKWRRFLREEVESLISTSPWEE